MKSRIAMNFSSRVLRSCQGQKVISFIVHLEKNKYIRILQIFTVLCGTNVFAGLHTCSVFPQSSKNVPAKTENIPAKMYFTLMTKNTTTKRKTTETA